MKVRFVWTQGFIELRNGSQDVRLASAMAAIVLAKMPSVSMVVARPEGVDGAVEDEGRTMVLRSELTFWAIRDDHLPTCTCGCGGRSIVTMLLPSEY